MPEAAKKEAKAGKTEKTEADKPKVARTNFSKMYPEDATVTLNVEENPKKVGSKARERFQLYFGLKESTVGAYLEAGGTYQSIAYDIGRGFITIG